MQEEKIRQLLEGVAKGMVSIEQAVARLRTLPYEDLSFAKIDHHRALRQGFPEVVFGYGKTVEQVVTIVERLALHADRLLVTRVGPECFQGVKERVPEAIYHPIPRAITLQRGEAFPLRPGILVVSGGTADMPVAEEAAITAQLMGHQVERLYDVGVAGIHRLLDHLPCLQGARVVVAVAGMEGALASVVGGLVAAPVIAVPTSIGYGASFGGLAPLLTMLNSCSAGVSVVNIDNGFGAGYLAALINGLGKVTGEKSVVTEFVVSE
ncbi:MAG: nickel pincer cofactor biosynthesis protein LarB [Chloroflexi bacterium]|nr:nickel pincer cofactor biosynthesis protein LarB [Chloroflexota bacterium]